MQVIGYVYDGAVYCDLCLPVPEDDEAVDAFFDHNEFDVPLHCDGCRCFLGGQLTNDGWKYLQEQCRRIRIRSPELLEQYAEHYDGYDWYFIPTHYGWMNPFGAIKDID